VAFVMNYFILPPIYRGSAVVYIAQINLFGTDKAQINNIPILKAKDVQSQIESDSFIQKLAQDLSVPSDVISGAVSVSTAGDSKIVIVSFDLKDKDLIKNFFKYFIIEINNFNNQAYQNQIESLKGQVSSLQSQVDSLDKQAEDVLARLKILEQKSATNSEYMLEYSQLRSVYDSIVSNKVDLVKQIVQIEGTIKASNIFFFQSEPLILDSPIKPHKLFNTAIAGLIAFLFSVLLALFLEYWKKQK
jgi:capsular polysaccharide biosynthesis protein